MSASTPNLLTDESRWLARIARFQRMAVHSTIESSFPFSASFVVGDGNPGTPTNGTSTYTNASLTGQVIVYKNGVALNNGTDYTHTSGSIVLTSPAVFTTGDSYVVLY